jgi:regulator of ribonuclease activity A
MKQTFKTADLCDEHGTDLQICEPLFRSFGGEARFYGRVSTVKCFEDNSLVREAVSEPGEGRVLVVDAGGSLRCAMLGDLLAAKAVGNGWSGVVMYGLIRDSADIARMPLGVKALGTHPLKSVKQGVGERDVTVRFAGVSFAPGQHLYADEDGIVCSTRALI